MKHQIKQHAQYWIKLNQEKYSVNLSSIYQVHRKMKDRLEKLSLRLISNDDTVCIGEVYLDNADALLKTCPPFVNFYEKTKEAILNAD